MATGTSSLTVGGLAIASAGGAGLGMANTYASDPNAGFLTYAAAFGTGGMNPLGEVSSSAGGLIGGGIAYAEGGDFNRGFMAGNVVGGILGGGLDDFARAVGKGATLANAGRHAAKYTGASVGFGAVGAGIGYAIGGTDGILAGASLGSAMANFAVACFTAGTPIVVDLEGNSRVVDELQVGDRVLARSEHDPQGPLELKRVEETFTRTAMVIELVVCGRSI